MRIYTTAQLKWDGTSYILDTDNSVWYNYTGKVDLACGATQAQTNLETQQAANYGTITQQLQTVFGNSGTVFQDLMNSYSPVAAAGPNQQGFSPQELASLNSQAITNVGQSYNNAKQAVGEQIAAQGGGNSYQPSGSQIGPQLSLAESAANQTSGELNQITQANYATGRQNWLAASQGLAGATNVYNPAVGFAGASTNAGEAAGNTANTIAQEQNSWQQALVGGAFGLAGAAIGDFSGSGSTGGSPFGNMTGGQISSFFGGPSSAQYADVGTNSGSIPYSGGGYPSLVDNTPDGGGGSSDDESYE